MQPQVQNCFSCGLASDPGLCPAESGPAWMSGGLPFIAGIGMSVHTWEGLSFPSCPDSQTLTLLASESFLQIFYMI